MKKPAKIGKGKSKIKLQKEAKRKRLPPKSPIGKMNKSLKKYKPGFKKNK